MDNDPCPDKGINKFTKVRGLLSQTWSFLDFKYNNQHFLFAGSDDGIFLIKNDSAIRMSEYTGGFTLYQCTTVPNKIFAGTRDRLNTLTYENGEFVEQIYEQDLFH